MPSSDRQRRRQRNRLAPHGRLPNRTLVVVAAAISLLAAVLAAQVR